MPRTTLLLLTEDPKVLIDLASGARAAGLTVAPIRFHELAIDALTRVPAEVALVDVMHEGADSLAFAALAQFRDTQVLLFARRDGTLEERARVALVSSMSPFPVIEYSGDPAELVTAVRTALTRTAAAPPRRSPVA